MSGSQSLKAAAVLYCIVKVATQSVPEYPFSPGASQVKSMVRVAAGESALMCAAPGGTVPAGGGCGTAGIGPHKYYRCLPR